MMRIFVLTFAIGALAMQEALAAPQDPLILSQQVALSATQETRPDTIISTVAPRPDSARAKYHHRIDAGYRLAPSHPYFRDEYRIIQDMRRLLYFVNPHSVHGYESVPDMFAKARSFPVSKQTEIIRVAVAGSVANFASEIVSRELREKKLRFVQWELEKVVFRGAFRYLNVNVFNGVQERGFGMSIPLLRLSFSRQSTAYYLNDSMTFWPLRRVAVSYARFQGRPIITPIVLTKMGIFVLSYDKDLKVITSAFDLRRAAKIVVRMVHVNHLKFPKANYLRSEVMLRW
jgi:hypothetical protein